MRKVTPSDNSRHPVPHASPRGKQGLGRRRVRQRDGRVLLRDAGVRTPRPASRTSPVLRSMTSNVAPHSRRTPSHPPGRPAAWPRRGSPATPGTARGTSCTGSRRNEPPGTPATPALATYLVLRTGPSILKGEAAKNWAEAAKSLGEAALVWSEVGAHVSSSRTYARLRRRRYSAIRSIIQADP